jgi:hypothetical protein
MRALRRAGFSILVVGAFVSPGLAAEKIEGWGAYRFGMTPDQVKAVPSAGWFDLKTEKIFSVAVNRLNATTLFEIAKRRFAASFYFQSDGLPSLSLQQLMFKNSETMQTAQTCEAIFVDLLKFTEGQHGTLQTTTPAQPETPLSYGSLKIEWRKKAELKSTYEVRDMKINASEGSPAEHTITAQAVKPFGQSYLSVVSTYDAVTATCESAIDVNRGVVTAKAQ